MVYVFLADGFEETEAIAPIDILRRAGLDVKTVGIGSCIIRGSHSIPIVTDFDDMQIKIDDSVDMIVLPGGMPGTLNLEKNKTVQAAIDYCAQNDRFIGAICAAPSILGHKGLLKSKKATCFPGFENELTGAEVCGDSVVIDGKIITAKGAGVAVEFGLALVKALVGEAKYKKLHDSMQCND